MVNEGLNFAESQIKGGAALFSALENGDVQRLLEEEQLYEEEDEEENEDEEDEEDEIGRMRKINPKYQKTNVMNQSC